MDNGYIRIIRTWVLAKICPVTLNCSNQIKFHVSFIAWSEVAGWPKVLAFTWNYTQNEVRISKTSQHQENPKIRKWMEWRLIVHCAIRLTKAFRFCAADFEWYAVSNTYFKMEGVHCPSKSLMDNATDWTIIAFSDIHS